MISAKVVWLTAMHPYYASVTEITHNPANRRQVEGFIATYLSQHLLIKADGKSQINMVHVILGGKRQSTKLDNPKADAIMNF